MYMYVLQCGAVLSSLYPILDYSNRPCAVAEWLRLRAQGHMSPWDGFETRHGLMPQIISNEMPDYVSDDEYKMDLVMFYTV